MKKMKSEGKVMYREKFNQIPIYQNLRYVVPGKRNECGIQSPTDVDMVTEFQKQVLIITEFKEEGNEMPVGQERTFTSFIDMTRYPYAFLLVAEHNAGDNEDYDASTCVVKRVYMKTDSNATEGEWMPLKQPKTVRECYDTIFETCSIDLLHYDEYNKEREGNLMEILKNL